MINPWMIYLMSCSNGILLVACIAVFVSFVCLIASFNEDMPQLIKRSVLVFIISVVIIIIIPSEQTCLAIIVSQTITPDNLPTDMYNYVKDLYETCGRVVNNR